MTEDVLARWRAATPATSDMAIAGTGPIRPPAPAGPRTPHGGDGGDDLGKLLNQYYGKLLSVDALRDYYGDSDFWNYGLWEHDTRTQADACLNLLDELLSFLAHTRGSILDVACGKGATTRELLDYYPPHQVTGINISPEQLAICARNAPGVSFLRMDATDLQFADESFDNVLCVEAACHFDTRRDFLREAHRVLKPGGRLAICDAVLPFSARGQPHANYVTSVAAYRDQCHEAGFTTVELFDRTRECWGGFSQHLLQYVRGEWRHGRVPMRAYRVTQQWLERVSTELYIVGYCGKA
jgi:SAM-dependent methyltransferase